MNQLYPIIRRKRRPLIEVDAALVVVGDVVTVPTVATKPVETIVPEAVVKASDANVTSK
jgi:hypothetical protein